MVSYFAQGKEHPKYHSTLATLAQIIYLFKMLKISEFFFFSKEFFWVKDIEEECF
jgi:hypothetical protein